MRRAVLVYIAVLVLVPVGAVYLGYGELEPCRVLAVEATRRTLHYAPSSPDAERIATLSRAATSQMSSGACFSALLDSWGERLAAPPN